MESRYDNIILYYQRDAMTWGDPKISLGACGYSTSLQPGQFSFCFVAAFLRGALRSLLCMYIVYFHHVQRLHGNLACKFLSDMTASSISASHRIHTCTCIVLREEKNLTQAWLKV